MDMPIPLLRSIALFLTAGLLEIGGGYLVWLWLRLNRPAWVGVAGFIALAAYGIVPVFQAKDHHFGRIYAAYGAVFIIMAMLWGWLVDHERVDARDVAGALTCIAGAVVLMWPRS